VFAFTSSPAGRRRRPGPTAASALLALAAALPASARPLSAEPIPWQDEAPLAAPFLQLPFEEPATVGADRVQIELRTIYSSSIAQAASDQILVDYHLESVQPTLRVRIGMGDASELHLELPGVAEVDPAFDTGIRDVESWFHTQNKLRRVPLSRQPELRLLRPDGRGVLLAGPAVGHLDPWLGVKGVVREQAGWLPAISWRAALKLPTSRFPFGSGVLEGGLGLLAGSDLRRMHLWLAADLMLPGGPVSDARLPTRPHPAFQLAIGRDLGPPVTLLVQASAHGPALSTLHLSEIDGWTFYVLAGARLTPTPSLSVGVGVVENVFVTERGTDIAVVLDLAARL